MKQFYRLLIGHFTANAQETVQEKQTGSRTPERSHEVTLKTVHIIFLSNPLRRFRFCRLIGRQSGFC